MKKQLYVFVLLFVAGLLICSAVVSAQATLKDVYKDYFLVGGALNGRVVSGGDEQAAAIAIAQYNTATPENDMKWQVIHPQPDQYSWTGADNLVNFAEEHDMVPIGHTLVWHSQVPRWVFTNDAGEPLTRDELLARMEDHITQVVTRYKGRIRGWDVVNEALNEDGTLRETQWYTIISEGKPEQAYDHIIKAFEFAHAADPDLELYYNDYNLESSRAKCDGAAEIVRVLKSKGIPVAAVGVQLHGNLNSSIEDLEYCINTLAATGVKVNVTELDIRTQTRGPGGAAVGQVNRQTTADANADTDETQQRLADKYAEFFKVFIEHADVMERITFWGVFDGASWIGGSPLLFDREYKPKQAFDAVIKVGMDAK